MDYDFPFSSVVTPSEDRLSSTLDELICWKLSTVDVIATAWAFSMFTRT